MNSLCATGSGMSGLTSGVAISGIPAPTGLTVNNSISIPLDSDPDLVLHYPLNGDILNYGSSTSLNTNLGPTIGVYDASFVPLTGSTVSLNSGQSIFKNGTSLRQSASNNTSYLSITNIPTNTAGYSFSFWINFTANTTGAIFSFANAYDTNVDRIVIWNSSGTLYFGCNNVFYNNSAIFPPLNTWRHFVWTLDTTGKTNIYVNGVLTVVNNTTVSYKSFVFNYNWILGDTFRGPTQYGALAYMNDFRYYNRILNSYEVNQLYNILPNSKSKLFSLNTDTTLALYYPFDSDFLNYASGVGVSDVSNNNNALISNYNLKVGSGSLSLVSSSSQYLKLNGVVATNINFIPSSGGCSFSIWFRTINNQSGARLLDFGNGGSGVDARDNIILAIEGNGITGNGFTFLLYYPDGVSGRRSQVTVFNATVNNGNWHHVVWTMSYIGNNIKTSNWRMYLDGSPTPISNTSANYYPLQVSRLNNYIGYSFNTPIGDALYNGFMDDFRYYKKVLSAAEVTTLYNYKSTYFNTLNLNSEPSLCLYYTFDTSTNSVSNYAQNVYGTVDANYVNGARANYTDLSYVGISGLKLLGSNSGYVQLLPTSVVNTINFIGNNGMTFACWFYSSDSSNNAAIFDFGTEIGDDIILSIFTNRISCKLLNTGTTYLLNSLATYNKSFRHVVWTMSYSETATSTWNLYIDASRVNTISTNKYPLQVARNTNYLGKSKYLSDPSFNGYIDDFRVYQRVLNQGEITTLFNYNNTLNVNSANLSWTAANTTKTPLTYNYKYETTYLSDIIYISGLQWKAFYGTSSDNSSYLYYSTTPLSESIKFNTFQYNSRYAGGANTLSSNSANVLTNISGYNNNIASTNNIFGFSNTGSDGNSGNYISLIIDGYFKPNVTGSWTFQFGITGSYSNDDISVFWINDGANVNGTTTHWPPSDSNYNYKPLL